MRFALCAALALMGTQAGAVVTYQDVTFPDGSGGHQLYWIYPEGVDNFVEGDNTFRIDIAGGSVINGFTTMAWNAPSSPDAGLDQCEFGGAGTICDNDNAFVRDFVWGSNYVQFNATKPAGGNFGEIFAINLDAPASYTVTFSPGVTNAVPEPASWALMIAGMGMIGATARRRRQSQLALP